MKTYKVGKIECDLAENADDLSLKRYAQLKEFLVMKDTGAYVPSIIEAMQGFLKGFDSRSPSEMLIVLHNYITGLKQVKDLEDADQFIFSVICLEKGEDRKSYDKTKAKEKIDRFNDEGLKQGEVALVVENFLKGSPILSGLYLMRSLANLKTD